MECEFKIKVDNMKLFDSIKQCGTASLGTRLSSIFLTGETDPMADIGLALYGIQIEIIPKGFKS